MSLDSCYQNPLSVFFSTTVTGKGDPFHYIKKNCICDYKVHILEHSGKKSWTKFITNTGQLSSSGTNVVAEISLQLKWLFICPLYYNLSKDVDF